MPELASQMRPEPVEGTGFRGPGFETLSPQMWPELVEARIFRNR